MNWTGCAALYKFQAIDGFTVVTGYPDGKDWIFEGVGRSGIVKADGDWLWQIASDRTFRVYDILQKTEKFRLELDNISPRDSMAVAGLDGQFIYLICPSSKSDHKPKPSRIYKLETVMPTLAEHNQSSIDEKGSKNRPSNKDACYTASLQPNINQQDETNI